MGLVEIGPAAARRLVVVPGGPRRRAIARIRAAWPRSRPRAATRPGVPVVVTRGGAGAAHGAIGAVAAPIITIARGARTGGAVVAVVRGRAAPATTGGCARAAVVVAHGRARATTGAAGRIVIPAAGGGPVGTFVPTAVRAVARHPIVGAIAQPLVARRATAAPARVVPSGVAHHTSP